MSQTETHHEPTPDELEYAGTEGGHQPGDVGAEPHGSATQVDAHGEHGHADDALGPVDVPAWGALVVGVAAGLVVVVCLLLTNSLVTPAA